jgi:flagellar FliL protein
MSENENIQELVENSSPEPEKVSKFNPKVLIIGLPLFIIQLVAVYFVTANVLMNRIQPEVIKESKPGESKTEKSAQSKNKTTEIGKFIASFDDIIVNPAGTNGQKLMLTSVSFDMPDEKQLQELKEKELIVKDIIINTLSNKTLLEVGKVGYKDTLKTELANNVMAKFGNLKISNVYFTKYIIQ